MLKAVLWDMDGTLIDSEPYWQQVEMGIAREHGGYWSEDIGWTCSGKPVPQVAQLMIDKGTKLTVSEVQRLMIEGVAHKEAEHMPWIEGVEDVLRSLVAAGIPSVLVTASPRKMAENLVRQAPEGAFVGYVCGEDDLPKKPNPAPYLAAAEVVGIKVPGEILAANGMTVHMGGAANGVDGVKGTGRMADVGDVDVVDGKAGVSRMDDAVRVGDVGRVGGIRNAGSTAGTANTGKSNGVADVADADRRTEVLSCISDSGDSSDSRNFAGVDNRASQNVPVVERSESADDTRFVTFRQEMACCVAIEDSMTGIKSAVASGATTIAQTGFIKTDTSAGPQFASINSYDGLTADALEHYVKQRLVVAWLP